MTWHNRDALDARPGSASSEGVSYYDDGLEAAANLLAVTIRTLVYDKPGSPSVNGQLGLATTLRFKDTAAPINPRNLLDTPGLVMMTTTFGVGGRYTAPLDLLSPSRVRPDKPLDPWWTEPVSKIRSATYSRSAYVLTTANKEGGAHVDPKVDELWNDLARMRLRRSLLKRRSTETRRSQAYAKSPTKSYEHSARICYRRTGQRAQTINSHSEGVPSPYRGPAR